MITVKTILMKNGKNNIFSKKKSSSSHLIEFLIQKKSKNRCEDEPWLGNDLFTHGEVQDTDVMSIPVNLVRLCLHLCQLRYGVAVETTPHIYSTLDSSFRVQVRPKPLTGTGLIQNLHQIAAAETPKNMPSRNISWIIVKTAKGIGLNKYIYGMGRNMSV